jgi:hypothetical protein
MKHSSNFLFGLIIGCLLVALFWYWNKSTTAEDGALALLDRFAAADRRARELEAEVAALKAPPVTATAAAQRPGRGKKG